MGWPKKTKDYKEYYPTDFITSDRGILFLWQARMVFSGLELTNEAPFREIFIHPTILTKEGKRMSKSLGTGINPLDLMEKYGTDALRFALAYQTTALQDMRFNENVISMGRKFANKLWNIARFITIKNGRRMSSGAPEAPSGSEERSLLTKLGALAKQVTQNTERYRFSESAHALYDFIWHDFADKYVEYSKNKESNDVKAALSHTLLTCLKLLHPFMPFITEEIYQSLSIKPPAGRKKMLLVEEWPRP
jgi:valyl-tRNA synthetase